MVSSDFQQLLLDFYEKNPSFVAPQARMKEVGKKELTLVLVLGYTVILKRHNTYIYRITLFSFSTNL